MKISILLSTIAALATNVNASDFKFSYPREGTQLTHSREFGVYWTATAGKLFGDDGYDLYFVPVTPDEVGFP